VDGVHQNLAGFVEDFANEPTRMPWGNRSLLFRDPDGNLVNFFHPRHPGRHRQVRPLTTPRSPLTQAPCLAATGAPRGSAREIALPLPVPDVSCAENCGPVSVTAAWCGRRTGKG